MGDKSLRGSPPCNHNYMSTQKQDEAASPPEQIRGWFTGRLPDDWFEGAPEILVDREEITVIGHLPGPARRRPRRGWRRRGLPRRRAPPPRKGRRSGPGPRQRRPRSAAAAGSVRRPVSSGWRSPGRRSTASAARFPGASSAAIDCDVHHTFSVPVMTRLRQSERRVLDTLVDAGVARSRSDALAWCVRLVGEHEDSWLSDLREALRKVASRCARRGRTRDQPRIACSGLNQRSKPKARKAPLT